MRMVLLKGYDERGFIFYTNYDSRKGRQLQQSGAAAFCMYWEPLQRQVRMLLAGAEISCQPHRALHSKSGLLLKSSMFATMLVRLRVAVVSSVHHDT